MPTTISSTAGYLTAHCAKRVLLPLNRKSANHRKTALRFVCSHVAEWPQWTNKVYLFCTHNFGDFQKLTYSQATYELTSKS